MLIFLTGEGNFDDNENNFEEEDGGIVDGVFFLDEAQGDIANEVQIVPNPPPKVQRRDRSKVPAHSF